MKTEVELFNDDLLIVSFYATEPKDIVLAHRIELALIFVIDPSNFRKLTLRRNGKGCGYRLVRHNSTQQHYEAVLKVMRKYGVM